MEVRKTSKKMPTPWKKDRMEIFSPWKWDNVLVDDNKKNRMIVVS
jgi:hypothetical protein